MSTRYERAALPLSYTKKNTRHRTRTCMREGVDFKSTVYTNSTRRLFDFIIKNF